MDIDQGYLYITNGTVDTGAGTVSNTASGSNIGTAKCKLVSVEHDLLNNVTDIPIPVSRANQAVKDSVRYLINLKRLKGSIKFSTEIVSEDDTNTWLRYKNIIRYLSGDGAHPDDATKYSGGSVDVVWETAEGYQTFSGVVNKILFKEQSTLLWKSTKRNTIYADIQIMVGELR